MIRFFAWLKGIWTSFCRLLRRNLFPNRIRFQDRQESPPMDELLAVTGTEKIDRFYTLSLSALMDKVKWRESKTTRVKQSVKGKINWD